MTGSILTFDDAAVSSNGSDVTKSNTPSTQSSRITDVVSKKISASGHMNSDIVKTKVGALSFAGNSGDVVKSRSSQKPSSTGKTNSLRRRTGPKTIRGRRASVGTVAGYADLPTNTTMSPRDMSSTIPNSMQGAQNSNSEKILSDSSDSAPLISQSDALKTSQAQRLLNAKNAAVYTACLSNQAHISLECVKAALGFGYLLKLSLSPIKMRSRIMKEATLENKKLKHEVLVEEERDILRLEQLYEEEDASSADEDDESVLSRKEEAAGDGGKLAFGRRKIPFFDLISADDNEKALSWLKKESFKGKKKCREKLDKYLKDVQKKNDGSNGNGENSADADPFSSDNGNGPPTLDVKLPLEMSLSLSAALLLCSLSFGTFESLEGMHKCYDGLVAAGTALIEEEELSRPKSMSTESNEHIDSNSLKKRKIEILNALTPILISTLESTSGEVIVGLAKMRNFCGTVRYKHRFIQRIAPLLIRPPNAAMWCLKHQADMGAIIAVTELIMDSVDTIFSQGWFERGRLILANERRIHSLNTAAKQLQALSASAISSSTQRKSHTLVLAKGVSMSNNEGLSDSHGRQYLAEWEVLAVDMHMRNSIKNVFTKDWTKISKTREIFVQSSISSSTESSSLQRLERRNSFSPRQFSPFSPHHTSESASIGSGHNQTSTASQSYNQLSNTNNPTNNSYQVSSRQSNSSNNQQQQRQRISSPDRLKSTLREGASSPNNLMIQPNTNTIVLTPPRSPSSPKNKKNFMQSSPLSRDQLLSSAPQIPIISNSSSGSVSPVLSDNRTQSPPAPPLSPTPLSVLHSSHRSQQSLTPAGSFVGGNHRPSAAERKRTVAACRALRAQISRFEDSFMALHGRPPKGQAERAPLSTTYTQYREWKRAIRADAACRIQALLRGAWFRKMVLEKKVKGVNDQFYSLWIPIIVKVRKKKTRLSVIAVEIGEAVNPSAVEEGVEIIQSPTESSSRLQHAQFQQGERRKIKYQQETDQQQYQQSQQQKQPQWDQQHQNRLGLQKQGISSKVPRMNGGRNTKNANASRESGENNVNYTYQIGPGNSSGLEQTNANAAFGSQNPPSSNRLSIAELSEKKRSLKNRLKQYDMDFHRKHKRMPVKAEKEPIRHLYQEYNALKSQIQALTNSGESSSLSVPDDAISRGSGGSSNIRTSISLRSDGADVSGDESIGDISGSTNSGRFSIDKQVRGGRTTSSSSDIGPKSTSVSEQLEQLRAEKTSLHQMLRSYERDFYREYQRQVSSFADIRPVASQYRRYKEIKKAISALQDGGMGTTR